MPTLTGEGINTHVNLMVLKAVDIVVDVVVVVVVVVNVNVVSLLVVAGHII